MDPNPREDTIARLQSNWTWVPDWIDASNAGEAARLVTFRRQVVIDKTPPECLVRLSADTRYKLSVNSERVCVGPSRGSDKLWFYDTVDLASHLKVGKNVIIIQVLRFFNNVVAGIPFARNAMPGLTILGQINGQDISTGRQDTEWEGRVEDGVYYPTGSKWDIFLHTYERVQSSAARQWQKLQRYRLIGHFGILSPWRLRPRMIPLAETTVAPFKAVRDAQSEHSAQEWTEFFHGQPLTLAPGTKHRVEVEYTTHSTAFVRLSASRAHSLGSKVSFTYSEAYQPQPNGRKGDRTKREGQGLSGPSDTYEFSGNGNGEVESYEPFWWKTFRFLVVEIEVGPDPLELLAFEATQTNYPMDVTAVWNGGSDEMDKMWEVSVRTMRNCMFDGYSDCPFYEQLQYCEDTRSAILFHYMLSGDDNLARQAITAFAASIQPDGIVCGRYPAHGIQIITGFALFWVLQVCDHMIHFDDKQFASEFLPTINSVLEWFERKTGNKGLVTNLPREYWSFIDWHGDWEGDEDFKDPGVPPAGRSDGTWSFMSMLYAYTLERVVTLCKQVGRPAQIDEYSSRAKRTIGAVKAHCFDGQAFTDSEASRKGPYSQQSQVWAVLSGCISGEDAKRLVIQAFIETNDFAVCSYPMMHYAFRALAEVDLYDQHFHALWEPWRAMLRNNLTTWEEDSVTMRSDCHEWSSLPIWEYTAEVAGLRPLEPGWSKLLFSPRLSLLPSLSASINLGKRGLAHVEWTTSQGGSMAVSIKLPENLHLISQLPDGREVDHGVCPGVQLEFNAGGQ